MGCRRAVVITHVTKTIADRLAAKRCGLYWRFAYFEKAFDSTDRGALWFKLKKEISDNTISCINNISWCKILCDVLRESSIQMCPRSKRGMTAMWFEFLLA
jgi:hypothetical protein